MVQYDSRRCTGSNTSQAGSQDDTVSRRVCLSDRCPHHIIRTQCYCTDPSHARSYQVWHSPMHPARCPSFPLPSTVRHVFCRWRLEWDMCRATVHRTHTYNLPAKPHADAMRQVLLLCERPRSVNMLTYYHSKCAQGNMLKHPLGTVASSDFAQT